MSINREMRSKVLAKYNNHCAYCGKEISYKGFQIDHLRPKSCYPPYDPRRDSYDNLMPSCRSCNHYKRTYSLEDFRELLRTLHKRVAKQYITNVAIDYGIVTLSRWDGLFYFERRQ